MFIRGAVFSVKTNGICFETDCQPLAEEEADKRKGVKKTNPEGKGVKDLKVDGTTYKSKKKAKVHPLGPQERIEQNVNKEAEPVTSFLKKGKQDGDGKRLEEKEDEKTTENRKTRDQPPAITTVILKIKLHCEGCGLKIQRTISKIKGVQKVEIDQQNDQIIVVGNMDVDSIANHLMEKFKRSVEMVLQEIIHDRDSISTENTYSGTENKETNDTGIKKQEENNGLKKKREGTDKEGNSDPKKKGGDIRDIGNEKGELHDKVDVNREANDMKEQAKTGDRSTNKVDPVVQQIRYATTKVEHTPGLLKKEKEEDRCGKTLYDKPPAVTTTVFKIRLHCEGCEKKICQIISKIEGVQKVETELENDLVRVVGNMDVTSVPECLKKNKPGLLLEIIHKGESSHIKQQENKGADGEEKESNDTGLKEEGSSEKKENSGGGKKKKNGNYIGKENKDTETKENSIDGKRKEGKERDGSSETKEEDGKVDTRFTAEHRGEYYRCPHLETRSTGENPLFMFNDENANSCSIM